MQRSVGLLGNKRTTETPKCRIWKMNESELADLSFNFPHHSFNIAENLNLGTVKNQKTIDEELGYDFNPLQVRSSKYIRQII